MIYGYDPWIILGLGLVIAFLGYMVIKGKNGKLMTWLGIIVIALAVVLPGGLMPLGTDTGTGSTVATGCPAGWEIDPQDQAASGWANLASAWNPEKTSCTLAGTINEGTSHYAWTANQTLINFSITPIPSTGASNDDVYTLYFRTDYNTAYNGEDMFDLSGSQYFANISSMTTAGTDVVHGYDGYIAMQPTDTTENVMVRYRFSTISGTDGAAYELSTVGLSTSWNIYFWDDCGHSYTYPVNYVTVVSA